MSFTPVLVPMSRGILATCTAPLVGTGISYEQTYAAYAEAYADEPSSICYLKASGRRPSQCSDRMRFTSKSQLITMQAGWSPSPFWTT